MALSLEQIQEQALALPSESRYLLAVELWSSLESGEGAVADEFSSEQFAELAKRAQEVREGTAVLVPYEEVDREILVMLGKS